MKIKVSERKLVPTDSLSGSPFNPPGRTLIKSNDELLLSMRQYGFLPHHPILLSNDGLIGDGHRRLAVAKLLGIPQVWVEYTDRTIEQLWSENNGKPPKTNEWDYVEIHSDGKVVPPKSVRGFHNKLVDLCGEMALSFVNEHGKSSRIASTVSSTIDYIGGVENQGEAFRVLEWMVLQNQQRPIIEAMRDNIAPELVRTAISENKPLRRGNWSL